jgi:hypothetical protein
MLACTTSPTEPIDIRPNPLKPFCSCLDRLLSASQALTRAEITGQDSTLLSMNDLIKFATDQLLDLFTKWVRESSAPIDAGLLYDQGALHLYTLLNED